MELDVQGWKYIIHRWYVRHSPATCKSTTDEKLFEGMRGIYRSNTTLAPTGQARIQVAYENMIALAELAGTDRFSCTRLVVYTTDMYRYRPICNQVQIALWGDDPNRYPPRTIVEVDRLNEDDIVEVEGTFWVP